MKTDVLIIGGGLAGLRLANFLSTAAIDFVLVEARDRIGGRILSATAASATEKEARFDLGPAWFWREQPLINNLIADLNLSAFEQYSTGRLVFQDEYGSVRRDLDFSTMAGSRRLVGGLGRLTEALAERI